MKIFLIILCAFLFKTEAVAQTWFKISPVGATGLKGMHVFEYDSRQFVLAYSDTVLYVSSDEGQTWSERKSYVEQCVFPPYEPIRFNYHSVAPGENGAVYITCEGFDCGSIDGMKMLLAKTHLDSLQNDDQQLLSAISTNLCHPYAHITNVHGKSNYVLYNSKVYYFEENISSLSHFFAPNSNEGGCGPMASRIFASDSRDTSTLYLSFVTLDSTGNTQDNLFKKQGSSGDWTLVSQIHFENENFSRNKIGAFRDLAFPNLDTALIMIASNHGLLRFQNGVMDTVLKTPINAFVIGDDGSFIFTGGDNGIIYGSYDYGNTWGDNIADTLSLPILDLAFKRQSGLIVLYALTDNGIWETPVNLVSVHDSSNNKNTELTITPNPANSSLKITVLKTELPQQLSIYNSLGQLVFKTEFSGEFLWDFKNDIPDGVYTVAVQFGGKNVAKQAVILK